MGLRTAGTAVLLPMGLLLVLTLGTWTQAGPVVAVVPIRVTVEGGPSNGGTSGTYSSSVVEGGVLLGALRRLQQTDPHFKFTVKEDPEQGLFLESVNGVAGGGERPQTYWELLSAGAPGEYTRLDVGIGCYKPKADEHIILRLSTWTGDV